MYWYYIQVLEALAFVLFIQWQSINFFNTELLCSAKVTI